ncbi:reverse transcriptase domain-containing protein [Tanacetum coccineum]
MAGVDVNTLTMEQYLALSRENQAPGVVKPEIGGNVNFEIKSQFMRELREDTLSENKDEDAYDHIDWVLSIVGLFNIPEVSKDAVMLRVGCQICKGPHPDKDCPLNEEVKQVEEVSDGEFRRTTPFNGSNGGKVRVGPPGYYTKIDNRPLYGKKRQSLEELLAKHQEESARRSTEMDLTKEIRFDKTLDSSSEQINTITADQETSGLKKLHGVSFISDPESDATEVLQHQLPCKELNPGNFTLLCTISKFNFYAMADLGDSINVMPRSIFEHLHLTNLRKTNMLCEMADMSKKPPLGIVENVLVKIGKFLFLSDFVIIDNTPSETTTLRRPFLATIRAEINVFAEKISLGINEDRISFGSIRNSHKYANPSERIFMVRGNWDNRSPNLDDRGPKKRKIKLDKNVPRAHFYSPIKQNIKEQTIMWPSCDPDKKMCDGEVEIYGVSKTRNLRFWYCNYDNERRNIKGKELSFPDFLFAKYGKSQTDALIWDNRYVEWCNISPLSKASLLKLCLIDCFQGNSAFENNPTHRSFDDYKWEFNLEIDKLTDEYELGIGKKGHILDHVWEYCNQVHNKNYEWHNYEFENEECEEIGIEDKEYHPPEVQVENFKNPEAKRQFLRPARPIIIGNLAEIAAVTPQPLQLRCEKQESDNKQGKKGLKVNSEEYYVCTLATIKSLKKPYIAGFIKPINSTPSPTSLLHHWKRISDKRMKNQARTDKTEHGMVKRDKDKVKSKPKSQPVKVKVNPEKWT